MPHIMLKTWLLDVLVLDSDTSVMVAIHMTDLQPIHTHRTQQSHLPRMPASQDYDLHHPVDTEQTGLRNGLTSYGDPHFSLFLRKVFVKAAGYSEDAISRTLIGIINTHSGFNPCHAHVPQLVEAAKRGIHLAGGLAIEFPTISLHESFSYPTSMFLRNLMSMDTEEMIRAQPMDACIMIGGCDKTVPAQLMGGISANKPVLPLLVGPMMPGSFKGGRIGACTDCRSSWAAYRAGEMDIEDIAGINSELAPTVSARLLQGDQSNFLMLTLPNRPGPAVLWALPARWLASLPP
jgi:dihydroxy-acid dehydratase